MACTVLRKFTAFKVVNYINPIGTMKIFMKNNCSLCVEEYLTMYKRICDKCVTLMKNIVNTWGLLEQNNFLPIFTKQK